MLIPSREIKIWLFSFQFLVLFFAVSLPADAVQKRSAAAKAEFRRQHPCPATGQKKGKCPGFEIDHIVPLCAGGADRPQNMQWLSKAAHKEKGKKDMQQCRTKRKKTAQEP
ncbi:MAG: HNH endonuclease [Betaproteobacteria bacterium]|nr:HNH endonuclease [Betaproteobacteria bacterium]